MNSEHTHSAQILVIDDEEVHREVLSMYLRGAGYNNITFASDGKQGWDLLQQSAADFDLLLLDRMLPGMDGIELLQRIKNDENLRHIPVILQTAVVGRNHVLEGIRAGAYHYLTKPYDEVMLLTLVESALRERRIQSHMQERVIHFSRTLSAARKLELVYSRMDEIQPLATGLAQIFPDPDGAVMGLVELMINAVEHGNLGISYDEKGDLVREGKWLEEVHRREQLPQYMDKKVYVEIVKSGGDVVVVIEDEGEGFDWEPYMNSNDVISDVHGRGLLVARQMAFDGLEFYPPGNKVKATVEQNGR